MSDKLSKEEIQIQEKIKKLQEKAARAKAKRLKDQELKEQEKWKALGEILLQVRSHGYAVDYQQVDQIICKILGEPVPKSDQKPNHPAGQNEQQGDQSTIQTEQVSNQQTDQNANGAAGQNELQTDQ